MNFPKLRFPGFEGEWEERRLDSMIDKFIVPMRDKPTELNGEIPWCRIEDFEGKYLHNSKSSQGVNTNTVKHMNLKIFPIDTLLVSCSANLGICAIVKKELITNQTFIGLVPDSTKIEVEFLFYFMTLSAKKLNSLSSGTTISYLSREQFERFEIILPSLSEQQKIASFLSSVDNVIQLLTKKKTLLENYKKGIMQKIFSQEIRFKDEDGNDFPDWEIKCLIDLAIINPVTIALPSEFYYIDLESVAKGRLLNQNYINRMDAPSRAQRLLQYGDIIFQTVRPYQRNNYIFKLSGNFVASTGYAQIRYNDCPEFLYQYLHTDDFVNEVLFNCTGTSYPAINSKDLGNLSVPVPSLPEQQKIADFLSGIDRTIEIVNSQVEKTKEYKKGLLQKMFV